MSPRLPSTPWRGPYCASNTVVAFSARRKIPFGRREVLDGVAVVCQLARLIAEPVGSKDAEPYTRRDRRADSSNRGCGCNCRDRGTAVHAPRQVSEELEPTPRRREHVFTDDVDMEKQDLRARARGGVTVAPAGLAWTNARQSCTCAGGACVVGQPGSCSERTLIRAQSEIDGGIIRGVVRARSMHVVSAAAWLATQSALNHGGDDQAVYAYARRRPHFCCTPFTAEYFGKNLTTSRAST